MEIKPIKMQEVLQLINSHDFDFRMSDDPRKFERGLQVEAQICRALAEYKIEDLAPHLDEWRIKELKRMPCMDSI